MAFTKEDEVFSLIYLFSLLGFAAYLLLCSRCVFVLAYHSIGSLRTDVPGLVVSQQAFRRQLRLLARLGFRAENLDKVLDEISGGRRLGRPLLCITFDDGYRTVLENALPVLRELNWPATLFVPTGHVGGTNVWDRKYSVPEMELLDWDELGRLGRMGIQIGSHGRLHRSMLDLSDQERFDELRLSLADLDAHLSRTSRIFCYPYGHRAPAMKKLAERAGYRGACSLVHDAFMTDRFDIGRVVVVGNSVTKFAISMATYPVISLARRIVRMAKG